MKSFEMKNKMWLYSSILFMGALLVITLSAIGLYGLKANGININPNTGVGGSAGAAQKDKQIKDLQSQNQTLQQEVTNLKNKPAGSIDVYNNLMQAVDFADSGDYTSAMNLMKGFNENSFQGYAKNKYSALVNLVNTYAAQSFYNNGMTAYRKADYQTAANQLSSAVQFGASQAFADRAAYYASLSFKALGDTEDEKKCLQIVINNYPKSTYQYKSKLRMDSLQ